MKKVSYKFDLKQAIDEFRKDFPEGRENIVFIDLSAMNFWNRRKLIDYATKEALKTTGKSKKARKEFNKTVKRGIRGKKAAPKCFSYDRFDADQAAIVVPLNPATPTYKVETFFGMFDLIVHSACTQPTETLCDQIHHFIFDHEVAHALGAQFDRNGDLSTQHLDESIADAYAALRHVQRYGENTGIIDMVRDCRITGALMGDLEHYSSPALDAAASWLCENDVTQMPPAALMVAATEISQNVCTSLNIHALVEEAKIEGLSIVDFINNFDLINLCIEDTGKKTQHKEVFDLCQNWFKAIKAYGLTDKNKCLEEKSRPWILSASKEAPGHKNAPRQPRQKALSL